jgi:adenylate cyclase class 2
MNSGQRQRLEVELKFALADPAVVLTQLERLGVCWSGSEEHRDHYFNHPARDFAQTDEALRIRSVGEENLVTYKGPKLDAATKTRRELEVSLATGAEPARDFAELLQALGFRPVAEVRKNRRHGQLAWQGHDVEVARDSVAGVGEYLELELIADDQGLDAARSCLLALARELDLPQAERRSYLELLLERRP